MIILIPSFEPDEKLLALISDLTAKAPRAAVVVVNDGSGERFEPLFCQARTLGATVIGYRSNHGKGQALKTGFSYIAANHPDQAVVCADSDGQHCVKDILRVAEQVETSDSMVVGERHFDGQVPLRSKFGNTVTRLFFALATGSWLYDTQTGLRGYPSRMLPWLQSVRGNRYEYELNILLDAHAHGHHVESIRIATIYLSENESSHFRPILDSLRIYAPLLKFSLSSLGGFAIDLLMFMMLMALTDSLLVSVVGARAVSAAVNFAINRRLVFPEGRNVPIKSTASKYLLLALGLLAANYGLLVVFTTAGIPSLMAKVLTESTLFLASFVVQKRFLFRHRKPAAPAVKKDTQARLSTDTDSAQLHAEI